MPLNRRRYEGWGLHTIVDVLLLAGSLALLFGWLTIPQLSLSYALPMAVIGIILVAVPLKFIRRVGFVATLVGTYSVLHDTGVISVEYLRYGLAGFLLLVATISIVRDAFASTQYEPPLQEKEEGSHETT